MSTRQQMRVRRIASAMLWTCALALLCLTTAAGCGTSRSKSSQLPRLPQMRPKPDSVILEIAVVEIQPHQLPILDQLFNLLDRQSLGFEARRMLDRNGIQAAVIPIHMPSELQLLLKEDPIDPDTLTDLQRAMWEEGLLKPPSKLLIHQRITNQAGDVHPVVVSGPFETLPWSVEYDGGRRAGMAYDARSVWAIQTWPHGNGSVRMVFSPEIHHGAIRPRMGVSNNMFLYESRQNRITIDEIGVETSILPGQTIIMAPTSDLGDLGGQMFTINHDGQLRVRFLLVRLVESHLDELFAPSTQSGSIAVSTD